MIGMEMRGPMLSGGSLLSGSRSRKWNPQQLLSWWAGKRSKAPILLRRRIPLDKCIQQNQQQTHCPLGTADRPQNQERKIDQRRKARKSLPLPLPRLWLLVGSIMQ